MSSTQRLRANVERNAATIEEGLRSNANTAPKSVKKKSVHPNCRHLITNPVRSSKKMFYIVLCAVSICYFFFHYILSHQLQFESVKFLLSLCGISSSFKSQHGQDRYAYQTFFPDASSGGTFIEFGARNGVDHSNTWFFEHIHQWHGVLLEPGPEYFGIGTNRPRSISFHNTACMQDIHEDKQRIFIVADIPGW